MGDVMNVSMRNVMNGGVRNDSGEGLGGVGRETKYREHKASGGR
jgi:hypothetical protein